MIFCTRLDARKISIVVGVNRIFEVETVGTSPAVEPSGFSPCTLLQSVIDWLCRIETLGRLLACATLGSRRTM
jgi:hypothetical protein